MAPKGSLACGEKTYISFELISLSVEELEQEECSYQPLSVAYLHASIGGVNNSHFMHQAVRVCHTDHTDHTASSMACIFDFIWLDSHN